jgi:hypothetical protein
MKKINEWLGYSTQVEKNNNKTNLYFWLKIKNEGKIFLNGKGSKSLSREKIYIIDPQRREIDK